MTRRRFFRRDSEKGRGPGRHGGVGRDGDQRRGGGRPRHRDGREDSPEPDDFWSRLLRKGPDNDFLERTGCPACGGMPARILKRLGPTYLRRCRACGMVYISPRLSEAVREEMYIRNPGRLDSPTNLMLRHFMADRLQNMHREMFPLEGLARNSASLLEVGCGWGHFLQLCRPHYHSVEGVELSREQAAHARERFDLDVSATDILGQNLPRKFHLIVAWEVLEHLAYPAQFLRWAHDHLLPGGQLILSTPNYDSIYRRLLGGRWFYAIPSQHLTYYTPAVLKAQLAQAGFAETAVFTSGRSLLRERFNGHNRIDRRADTREQWLETLRIRDRIETERAAAAVDTRNPVKRVWNALFWRLSNALVENGWGDQMRVYARKP